MIGGVFFSDGIGLVSPVDSDFLLMNSSAVESVHSTICSSRIVILNEAVVETLGVEILVGDDLDTADMTSSVKDLLQDIFCYTRVQAADIQRSLVWFWRSSSDSTSRRHDALEVNSSRGWVVVLGDDNRGHEWWRRHRFDWVIAATGRAIVARSPSGRRWRRKRSRRNVFGHGESDNFWVSRVRLRGRLTSRNKEIR